MQLMFRDVLIIIAGSRARHDGSEMRLENVEQTRWEYLAEHDRTNVWIYGPPRVLHMLPHINLAKRTNDASLTIALAVTTTTCHNASASRSLGYLRPVTEAGPGEHGTCMQMKPDLDSTLIWVPSE